MSHDRVRALATAAVAVALSVVLYNFVFYKLPNEGRITAGSMVPLFYAALQLGFRWGLLAGIIAGVLNFLLGPVYVHPVQWLLDYPVAFGLLALAGLFPRAPVLGIVTGGVGRFAAHYLSGVVFFAAFAPSGTSPWLYSLLYNGSYMLPEIIISVVLTLLVVRSMARIAPAAR